MEFLKKYGYIFLFIAAAMSFFVAVGIPEHRVMYLSIGTVQLAVGALLLQQSKKA